MKNAKAAMCQIFCLDGDRLGNFVRIENAICEAKDAGADIACFPETAILGWVNPDAHKRAFPIPGEDSGRLCRLAKVYNLHFCIGLAEKEDRCLYDSVVLIDSKGNILLKHRKMNLLTELMNPPYTPGESIDVIETKFGRIGLLICADTHDSKILERMAALKPDILLIPYGYAAAEEDWPGHGQELEKVVINTAEKTGAFVIGTNLVGEIVHGPWKGRTYGGQSVASDRTGRVVVTAKDRDRDIKIISIKID
jgi:predicted amidohydrolase